MSLQQIMDATPIVSWGKWRFGEYIGSAPSNTYLLAPDKSRFILYWYQRGWEETERLCSADPETIIGKINELEGIKFTVKNIEEI